MSTAIDIDGILSRIKAILSRMTVVESDWKFVTSAGVEASAETPLFKLGVNVTGGLIRVKRDSDAQPAQLNFGGVGGSAGLGLVPIPPRFSFSLPEMPSAGCVYKLPPAGDTLSLQEMKGGLIIIEVGADAGAGVSGGYMFLGGWLCLATALGVGSMGLLHVPTLLTTSNACVKFGGMTANAIPYNVGVAVYFGMIR
jgi:hypothetical protein